MLITPGGLPCGCCALVQSKAAIAPFVASEREMARFLRDCESELADASNSLTTAGGSASVGAPLWPAREQKTKNV